MRYLLLIRHDDSFTPPAGLGDETLAWIAEMDRRRIRVYGERLAHYSEATIVAERGSKLTTTTGLLGTVNEVAGYDLIDVTGAEQAREVAAAHPMSRWGSVEIRRVWTP